MTWRTARSITTLHAQLKAGAPRAAPPATSVNEWGTIGDALHDPTSDHAPHDFPGWGIAIVTAGDFPNRPDLGLDAHRVLDDIRRSQDPRAKYGISNGQIFSNHAVTQGGIRYDPWEWRPYNGSSDKHYTHGHLSVVGDARADGTQPWATIGAPAVAGEDDEDMGQSFGPVQVLPADQGPTSLTIPPVQAGLADPRKTWLNIGGDFGNARVGVRVWASDGGGRWRPVDDATSRDGLHVLANGVVFSIELQKGDRILSVSRKAVNAGGAVIADDAQAKAQGLTPFAGSISVCFERA